MHWTVCLDGGPRRVNHAAVGVGDKIYSFGGYCTGEDSQSRIPIDVHMLNTEMYHWSVVRTNYTNSSDVPFQRYGHTAVAYKNKVYIWGGRNDLNACNILYCLDTSNMLWSVPRVTGIVPGARDGHTACVIGHCMYIFGGFEEEAERFSQDVHVLDFKTMVWSFLYCRGEPPSYRDFHSATALNNRMYIFGGRGDEHSPYHSREDIYSSEIMYLDIENSRWHKPVTTGFLPTGRRSHSAFIYNGNLYVFGGYNGLKEKHYNDLICFMPDKNEWQTVKTYGQGPCPRRRQACIVIGHRMFLFGGTSPYTFQDPEDDEKLMDHNDLHVLDFCPTLKTLCILVLLKNRLDQTWLPESIKYEIRLMTTPNSISRPLNSAG